MKYLRLFVIGVLAGVVLTSLTPSAGGSTPERLLLIVAGQSNATGARSFATDPTTGIDYLGAPYTNGADAQSTIAWEQSYIVTHADSPVPLDTPQMLVAPYSTTGPVQIFGPEIGLAREVYVETGQPVTIVKVAFDNTNLRQWAPGGILWKDMVRFVQGIESADARSGQTDVVGGFYWVQGEADAGVPAWAAEYQANLTKFVVALRRDLVPASAPIVLAKMWVAQSPVGSSKVRAADAYVAAHASHVFTVDTKELPRYSDHVHLLDTSELTLGEQMAMVAVP